MEYPNHVGIILDGNRRWAKERGLPTFMGHKKGLSNLKKLAPYIINKGVKYLSVYAFSSENFNRDSKEVNYLMNLFVSSFEKEFDEINKENIKVVFSGRRDNLREDVLKAMDELTRLTEHNTKGVFNICLGYGGRQEIIDAIKKIHQEKVDIDKLDEEILRKYMYQDLPDLDLLIRTSGEQRLSNFMLYQVSYAELYFPDVYFPAFNKKQFDLAIKEYEKRNRRYGK